MKTLGDNPSVDSANSGYSKVQRLTALSEAFLRRFRLEFPVEYLLPKDWKALSDIQEKVEARAKIFFGDNFELDERDWLHWRAARYWASGVVDGLW